MHFFKCFDALRASLSLNTIKKITILWGVCCANWSAHDLRSADDHARARSCVFKACVQPFFIRTLEQINISSFDRFEALIIYVTLHHSYEPGLHFRSSLYFCPSTAHASFTRYSVFTESEFSPPSLQPSDPPKTYSAAPTMATEAIEDSNAMSSTNKLTTKYS